MEQSEMTVLQGLTYKMVILMLQMMFVQMLQTFLSPELSKL